MKYAFNNLIVEEMLLQPPIIRTECTLTPENETDTTILNKLLRGCTVYADSSDILPAIKNVYFNPPATVVLWDDGTKTVVKCQNSDTYSKETGLALCIAKKAMGNKGNYNDIFRKWIPEEKTEEHFCRNCKYEFEDVDPFDSDPCYSCDISTHSNWKPIR